MFWNYFPIRGHEKHTMMNDVKQSAHSLPIENVLQQMETTFTEGLSSAEVKRRSEIFGPNMVTGKKQISLFVRFLMQFNQALVYVLLIAGFVSAILGEWGDASVIFGVVIINSLIGCIQESRAEKAIESLKKMIVTEAHVLRNGERHVIPSIDLVPGDIVFLQAGDKIPADLRLHELKNLRVDESSLTGESIPVEKSPQPLSQDTVLADRLDMAYAGSLVTSGLGDGVVIATGNETETGRISRMISESTDLSTPLTRKIEHFSHFLLYAITGLAVVAFIVGSCRYGWTLQNMKDMFMAAVALAVGAIPEGLPAVVTITLAIGVRKMARRRAIIRKLPAAETLGSTTIICTDKTGTLTENQMTVRKILAGTHVYDVTGNGYSPEGDILLGKQKIVTEPNSPIIRCLTAGVLCNDARLLLKENRWAIQGDPTEGALLTSARKAGLLEDDLWSRYPRRDVLPFESEYRYMATLNDGYVYLKGSVEAILHRCKDQMNDAGQMEKLDAEKILATAEAWSNEGLRVLAFAQGAFDADKRELHPDNLVGGMTFLGLQAMIDPPRQEAADAVVACRKAGIRVKMITGDHAGTASAIGKMVGLAEANEFHSITGRELADISDDKLSDVVEHTHVFARIAPEQKLRLVNALQARGHVVAMTGDGVNDAPALKQADIGIAMGITGTEVAKEAADMLLTDDNFATIESAVEEGRGVFDNLTKFIAYILPTNGGQGLIVLAAILAGVSLPILPIQILWINMTIAVFGLVLAFEPREPGLMDRPPRRPDAPIMTRDIIIQIITVCSAMLAGTFGLYMWHLGNKPDVHQIEVARTIAVNAVMVIQIFYLFLCRSLTHTISATGFFSNRWAIGGTLLMIAIQIFWTHNSVMNRIFKSAPLSFSEWMEIFLIGLVGVILIGLEKHIRIRRAEK
jgi:Ca2+-transporting ATPase